jgi:lipopolysaccharide transport protein LptA
MKATARTNVILRAGLCLLYGLAGAAFAQANPDSSTSESKEKAAEILNPSGFQGSLKNEPTYVKSDSLTLNSKERLFTYVGNAEVRHGDMTMTCDTIQGRYDQNNQIQTIAAVNNVVITKGENIRATSQKAIYDAAAETVTLSENPELQQGESVLTADAIKLFLRDNRSEAEGEVRVKVVKLQDKASSPGQPAQSSSEKGRAKKSARHR